MKFIRIFAALYGLLCIKQRLVVSMLNGIEHWGDEDYNDMNNWLENNPMFPMNAAKLLNSDEWEDEAFRQSNTSNQRNRKISFSSSSPSTDDLSSTLTHSQHSGSPPSQGIDFIEQHRNRQAIEQQTAAEGDGAFVKREQPLSESMKTHNNESSSHGNKEGASTGAVHQNEQADYGWLEQFLLETDKGETKNENENFDAQHPFSPSHLEQERQDARNDLPNGEQQRIEGQNEVFPARIEKNVVDSSASFHNENVVTSTGHNVGVDPHHQSMHSLTSHSRSRNVGLSVEHIQQQQHSSHSSRKRSQQELDEIRHGKRPIVGDVGEQMPANSISRETNHFTGDRLSSSNSLQGHNIQNEQTLQYQENPNPAMRAELPHISSFSSITGSNPSPSTPSVSSQSPWSNVAGMPQSQQQSASTARNQLKIMKQYETLTEEQKLRLRQMEAAKHMRQNGHHALSPNFVYQIHQQRQQQQQLALLQLLAAAQGGGGGLTAHSLLPGGFGIPHTNTLMANALAKTPLLSGQKFGPTEIHALKVYRNVLMQEIKAKMKQYEQIQRTLEMNRPINAGIPIGHQQQYQTGNEARTKSATENSIKMVHEQRQSAHQQMSIESKSNVTASHEHHFRRPPLHRPPSQDAQSNSANEYTQTGASMGGAAPNTYQSGAEYSDGNAHRLMHNGWTTEQQSEAESWWNLQLELNQLNASTGASTIESNTVGYPANIAEFANFATKNDNNSSKNDESVSERESILAKERRAKSVIEKKRRKSDGKSHGKNKKRSSEQHQQLADNENEESSSERVPIKKRAKRTRNVNQLN